MNLRFDFIWRYFPLLLEGTKLTVQLTVAAVAIGTIIGLFISLLRISHFKPVSWAAKIYVDFFRGTPLLVQIFLFYFGIPQLLGLDSISRHVAGIIALGLNSGAYVAEIFRSGILSVHKGQMEAARSLGMTYAQAMRYVVLPQAFKVSIPPLGNEFIAMLKDSSLVSVISLSELMHTGRMIVNREYRAFETYIIVALFYLVMTTTISRIVAYLERVFGKDDHSQ